MNLLNIFRMNSLIQKLYPLAMVNKYAVNTYGKLNLVESKERISRISNLLCVQNLEENRYIRFGDSSDGGYVLANNISDRDVCISIGIGDNISFDRSISSLVSNIFMYDHTIAEIDHNIPNALFIRMGLSKEEKPQFRGGKAGLENKRDLRKPETAVKIDEDFLKYNPLASIKEMDRSEQFMATLTKNLKSNFQIIMLLN